ncbi:MAG TPA: RiPP maturation radical SAM C-methyltransferase [Candidatus Angelobacter sp.]|nr:RiPP maturation radical SAM C-methyltransferase [Candidatus Angelobacter sp.]
MYKISLINMPFADLWFPSIALTQIKAILEEKFQDKVSIRVHYMNQEIAQYLGVRLYCYISNSLETNMAALGDWLFREIAFPGQEENMEAYFKRCFPQTDPGTLGKKQLILRKRKGLGTFLERLIAKYSLTDDDLVGFTSMFCQNVASFAMAKKIKDQNPNIITVIGGANCEAPMGAYLVRNVEQIDYAFSGPALISFPKFVQQCLDGNPGSSAIQGVFSKRLSANSLSGHDSIGEELDINHYVPLNYAPFLDTLARNFSNNEISPVLLFETSRGCWWGQKSHCTFCGLNGGTMAYRAMQPAAAIRQFEDLFKYSSRCSSFNAVDNILPKSYIAEVLPHINPPENVELFYEVKADLSKSDVEALAKAHVSRVQPGIESLATSTLKLMKKGTIAFQNLALLKNCLIHGVHPEWNLLIGFPGEPETVFEKYVRDLPLLFHLPPPSGTFHVRFDRYSPYFTQAKEYGLDLHPSDFYNFIYPFSEEVLANIAYYFADHNYSAAYIGAVSEWSARVKERVEQWRTSWEAKQGIFPKLAWRTKGDTAVIYDSRSGKAVQHELSPEGVELLRHLVIPKRHADILKNFGHFDSAKELEILREKGLVFEEDQRYMSLVMEQDQQEEMTHVPIRQLASESPTQGLLA